MNTKAFSLIEMLTVAAIVAIIAAFAIPSYMYYLTETKVNSLFQEAEAAKLAVQSQHIKQHTDVSTITVNSGVKEYTTSNTDYVQCVTVQNGVVSVVGDPNAFFGKSIWISWTPNVSSGELTWSCTFSDDAAEYLSDIASACGADTCSEYGTWSLPTAVGSAESVWYFGDLGLSQVSSSFAEDCRIVGTSSSCTNCYDFIDTDTEVRYMDFSLSSQTYNYAGQLGGSGWGAAGETWTYDYDYTLVTQTCMRQTRTKNDCALAPPTSFSSDAGCT